MHLRNLGFIPFRNMKSISILKKKYTLVTLDRDCAAMLMLSGLHKRHLKAWAGLFKAGLR